MIIDKNHTYITRDGHTVTIISIYGDRKKNATKYPLGAVDWDRKIAKKYPIHGSVHQKNYTENYLDFIEYEFWTVEGKHWFSSDWDLVQVEQKQ